MPRTNSFWSPLASISLHSQSQSNQHCYTLPRRYVGMFSTFTQSVIEKAQNSVVPSPLTGRNRKMLSASFEAGCDTKNKPIGCCCRTPIHTQVHMQDAHVQDATRHNDAFARLKQVLHNKNGKEFLESELRHNPSCTQRWLMKHIDNLTLIE